MLYRVQDCVSEWGIGGLGGCVCRQGFRICIWYCVDICVDRGIGICIWFGLVWLRCEMGSRAHIGQALRALYTHKGRITCEGRVQSLPQFAHRVASLAEGLSRLGLQLGDRVVIASLNRFAFRFILSQLLPVNQWLLLPALMTMQIQNSMCNIKLSLLFLGIMNWTLRCKIEHGLLLLGLSSEVRSLYPINILGCHSRPQQVCSPFQLLPKNHCSFFPL